MKIILFNYISSTHTYLYKYYKKYNENVCITSKVQTNGIGSRSNKWTSLEGNLFFSFSFDKSELPNDLNLSSISIYFASIMYSTLKKLKSKVWLKWPNDFYIDNKKIGGVMSSIKKNTIICSMGINTKKNEIFKTLDINVDNILLLDLYFKELETLPKWNEVFNDFKIQFENQKSKITTNINNQKVSLKDATINEDGSITVNNQKVYSLR